MPASTITGSLSTNRLLFTTNQNQTNTTLLSNQISGASTTDGGATTIVGADSATSAFSISSGLDGLYFVSGINSVGGAISIEGGSNTLIGGHIGAPAGLAGNWTITTSGGQTIVTLGTGSDTVLTGGSDTVHAGGANVLIQVAPDNPRDPRKERH